MIKSLWMLVASLLFALMAAFARMGASDFSALELVFYRSAPPSSHSGYGRRASR